jgi:Peptidase family S64
LATFVLAIGAASMPAGAFIDCSQQSTLTRPIPLGVSGGNISSFLKIHHQKFCSSGTLGSLVQDQSNNQFILSNNHVLADVNKAKRGQLIVQPGLVDTQCQKISSDAVAKFSRTVKIKFGKAKNTIDAAIAAVISGDVSSDILNIGSIASSVVTTPTVGIAVQKMGRSTCLTTGMISAVGVNGKVGYPVGGKVKSANFVNQIVIDSPAPPNNFGGPGDSGSLIVTQDACPQAVALLFAGSADQTMTIANPISAVLSRLNVSMVGSCTPVVRADTAPAEDFAGDLGLSNEAVASTTSVRDRHEDELMSIPGAVGTGIGAGDQAGQPAIVVYVKKLTPEAEAAAPKEVEGVPVKLIANGGFVAY